MRIIFCFCLVLLSSIGFAEGLNPDTDFSAEILPVFEYANWGGYFVVEKGELNILELISKGDRDFIGFVKKVTGFGSGKTPGHTVPLNLSTTFPSFVSFDDFDKVWKPKVLAAHGAGSITVTYEGKNLMIEYNNESPLSQNTTVYLNKNKKYRVISIDAFYCWHMVYDHYLVLATQSQGGSGHTIYLSVYNIQDFIN